MNLNSLVPVGIVFVVAAIALSLGANVVSDVQDDYGGVALCGLNSTGGTGNSSEDHYSQCPYAFNISGNGLEAGQELASWIPTIALVVAASIIIGIVVRFLGRN